MLSTVDTFLSFYLLISSFTCIAARNHLNTYYWKLLCMYVLDASCKILWNFIRTAIEFDYHDYIGLCGQTENVYKSYTILDHVISIFMLHAR